MSKCLVITQLQNIVLKISLYYSRNKEMVNMHFSCTKKKKCLSCTTSLCKKISSNQIVPSPKLFKNLQILCKAHLKLAIEILANLDLYRHLIRKILKIVKQNLGISVRKIPNAIGICLNLLENAS